MELVEHFVILHTYIAVIKYIRHPGGSRNAESAYEVTA
jgi:hypothetical protein